MNSLLRPLLTPVLLGAVLLAAPLHADTKSPGYFDLGTFAPPTDGGQFVEVDLKGHLLAMAARVAAKEEPGVAEVLRGIESIRVNVVGVNKANRVEMAERIKSLRSGLTTDGWERIVTVQEGDQDVTVLAGNEQAVFVNVVGDINPEKLAELGEHFGIEPLKKIGGAVEKK